MQLKFTKMHGCGNDFMVVDLVSQYIKVKPSQIRRWADRHFGVGFDQFLMVEPPQRPDADFRYRIFNADGGEVEQCGNGARCFAQFVRDKKLSRKNILRVETMAGLIELEHCGNRQIRVNMGVPGLTPDKVPFDATERTPTYPLEVAGEQLLISAVSMGNPHAVLLVDDVETADVARLGPLIESHPRFPQRVNAGFMQVISRNEIRLRVYERGAGETLACGTGACAAVVAGQLRGLLNTEVKVHLPGGTLTIEWPDETSPVMMTGPSAKVYEGQIFL